MAANDKDTIYIDIDDEITGIIDKLKTSDGKVIALVLPKRAAVFQSIVNMKLLKRAADASKKNLVLITSEVGLLPLAGAAGVHVAKTLTSKPEIPLAPPAIDDGEETVQEDNSDNGVPADPNKTVGQLAGAAAAVVAADGVETLVLDDEVAPPEDSMPAAKTFEPPLAKKNKKLAIPNFERFRLLLALGVLILIALIGGMIYAVNALPKATISIKTDATNIDTTVPLNLATNATALQPTNNTIPAKLTSLPKTYTQQVPTTGQKNNGNKASGAVVFYNCDKNDLILGQNQTIPAGTGISNNGQTYITQQNAVVPPSNFKSDGTCKNNQPSATVNVLAQAGGATYNITGGSSFSVSFSNPSDNSRSFSATTPDGTSGGTDSIVQTVNQNDITSAKSKITPSEVEVKQLLAGLLEKDNYYTLVSTYVASTPTITMSATVGDVANTVTVTEVITYTEFGVHKDDLRTLIQNNIKGQIDTTKQTILSDGLDKALFTVDNVSATGGKLTMTTKAAVGPDLNIDTIKQQVAGKKPPAIQAQFQNNPDVTSVDVKLSPFWVSSVPKKPSRIIVIIAKPVVGAKASTHNVSKP